MFEGRYSLAVSPEGAVIMPPAIRKEMQRSWGKEPELLCFGVQFLYICRADHAERILRRLDDQLCASFAEEKWKVTEYFRRMEGSVVHVRASHDGRFMLPQRLMNLLEVSRGGLLTLLGVEDHLEVWNRAYLEQQTRVFDSRASGGGNLLETLICLQEGDSPCSLLRGGLPDARRCGPCVFLRVP